MALLSKLDLQNVHFRESPPGPLEFPFFYSLVKLVSNCIVVIKQFASSLDYAEQSVHLVAEEGLEAYLPLADMVDISAEVQRLSKRLSKMQSEYEALIARLSAPSVREL